MAKKYISPNPESRILGLALNAVLSSIKLDEFADLVEQNGLNQIDPEAWYPTQLVLNMYKAISEQPNGSENLVSIGVKVYQNAILPPEVNSILTALHTLNAVMDLNMRNVESERYEIEQLSDQCIRVTETTAFPHDLIYGYLYGICRRFAPAGTKFHLQRTYLNPEDPDADGAVYDITWE